ncbi:MAG: hypothetical protein LBR32_08675, partial [Propionibacteriaceae bacterium]|nr:hypothetical protein [Propionibacteriaceae bacterium]
MARNMLWAKAGSVCLGAVALIACGLPNAYAQGPQIGGSGNTYYLNDSFNGTANLTVYYGD